MWGSILQWIWFSGGEYSLPRIFPLIWIVWFLWFQWIIWFIWLQQWIIWLLIRIFSAVQLKLGSSQLVEYVGLKRCGRDERRQVGLV